MLFLPDPGIIPGGIRRYFVVIRKSEESQPCLSKWRNS